MANRKFLIENILGLAQKLGANPNKFMGTKQNINFLGTGDRGMRGTTFSAKINDDFLNMGGETLLLPENGVSLFEWASIIEEVLPGNIIKIDFTITK